MSFISALATKTSRSEIGSKANQIENTLRVSLFVPDNKISSRFQKKIFCWILVLGSSHAFISSLLMKLDFFKPTNRPQTPPFYLQDKSTCNNDEFSYHNFT